MSNSIEQLATYLLLSKELWHRLIMMDRDRLLVIAGAVASEMHLESIASYCRFQILEHNQGHMLRKYPSFAVAMSDPDFLFFLKQVRRRFPHERAETLLDEYGLSAPAPSRQEFDSDEGYLCTLLGIERDWLRTTFGGEA